MLKIDNENYCIWRPTPWDQRVLGVNTADILDITYTEKLEQLFELVDEHNKKHNIGLCYFRHEANDLSLKKAAVENGFLITEFSLYACHNNLSKIKKTGLNLEFIEVDPRDLAVISEVKEIATTSFKHGRFHEDPCIELSLAQKRYEMWINDLIDTTHFFTFKIKGKVAGFFCYKKRDESCLDLPLAGLSEGAKGIGGFLWANMFSFVCEHSGLKKMKILISSSNTDVLNLYAVNGFTFREPLFGYHKHYK